MKSFLGSLGIFFSNNVDIEVAVNLMLDDFRSDDIILFFPSNLGGGDKLHTRLVYHILDLFFFDYSLRKVSPLGSVLKAAKFLFFALILLVFGGYYDGGNIRG